MPKILYKIQKEKHLNRPSRVNLLFQTLTAALIKCCKIWPRSPHEGRDSTAPQRFHYLTPYYVTFTDQAQSWVNWKPSLMRRVWVSFGVRLLHCPVGLTLTRDWGVKKIIREIKLLIGRLERERKRRGAYFFGATNSSRGPPVPCN